MDRLGAMVRGGVVSEDIDINEDTYWSGGPYDAASTPRKGTLAEVQKSIFGGEPRKAHRLFGREMYCVSVAFLIIHAGFFYQCLIFFYQCLIAMLQHRKYE